MSRKKSYRSYIILFFVCLLILSIGYFVYKAYQGEAGQADATETVSKPDVTVPSEENSFPDEAIEPEPDTEWDDSIDVDDTFDEHYSLYIPSCVSLFAKGDVFTGDLSCGKVYYKGREGRLESSLYTDAAGVIHEDLVSYDRAGNEVDRLQIGLIDASTGKRMYARISVAKVSTYTILSSEQKESVTEYSITPQLRFIKGKTFVKLL